MSLDHLVFAVPDLAGGVRQIWQAVGVEPGPGGSHPGWGTWNALLSLGQDAYLEVIAPDPAQEVERLPFGVREGAEARLSTWAARSGELEAIVARAKAWGMDLGEIRGMQRVLPDGSVLSWRLTDPFAPREGGLIPFFIDWGDSRHPSTLAPTGCSLRDFWAECPEPQGLQSLYDALGIDLRVRSGMAARLVALLDTPNGLIELS